MAASRRRRPAPPAGAQIEFRSRHAGLTLMGLGWHAQFIDGRFTTDDPRTAEGIAREAEAHPEYGIAARRAEDAG